MPDIPNYTENAIKVLESRYLIKNAEGKLMETPLELFRRVAAHVSKAELHFESAKDKKKWEELFFELMSTLKFLPNSPTLMNAGTALNQLSACFVLPVNDSIESIFSTLKNTALIQQSGGGTGFNFSALRPKGDFIFKTSSYSTGPIAFMKIFNEATENIKQGGKRRGANMGILNIDHPDIEEFISVKKEEGVLSNFNISVGITDDFMHAVEKNEMWELKHPSSRKVMKKIKAGDMWKMITECAWASGDPGLIFLDTIEHFNPTPSLGRIICTNPCGEVPLLAYEACNLGSIDVSKFFNREKKQLNWNLLEEAIAIAVRFLDNVIEINNYVIPEIKSVVTGNRKIGLGIMGWADLLIRLKIPYASEKALIFGEQLMKFMSEKSEKASSDLAKERGVFKNWEKSIYYPDKPLRNATRTSIAPTGTISIIANTSSSIEPLFALSMHRENVLEGQSLSEFNSLFTEYLRENNLYSEKIVTEVNATGSAAKSGLPDEAKLLFKTSLEIEPAWHIKHQVVFQKYTDNAVSKTINLPAESTVNDVSEAYFFAWKQKTKGVTVFRYGSKQKQVLKSGTEDPANLGSCRVCAS